MGLLDGVLGGAVGAEMATVVNSLIQQHGGVQGIVTQLEQQGLGNTVRSWIGTGPNQSISPDELSSALGPETVDELSQTTGLDRGSLLSQLSHALPQVVDGLTPNGRVPDEHEESTWV
ncbi:MAG: DUF937 domain-containing protein [Methylobacteriaceae bacterium]|nr:DUF937 domain-containing protein [Methylobacteriaceae bacterium]